MRIVVWNVCGGAREKLGALELLAPDVAIVPECERNIGWDPRQMAWNGSDGGKGLAVLAFGEYTVERYDEPAPDEQRVMPVDVSGPNPFRLLAVWARTDYETIAEVEEGTPIGPLRRALARHERWISRGPAVVAGDFNQNAIWDRPLRPDSHSYAVADLTTLGLSSAYHRARGCAQGAEPEPTFYMAKDRTRGYHIDYVYVPDEWAVDDVRVFPYDDYCRLVADGGLSDHAPVKVDVTVPERS